MISRPVRRKQTKDAVEAQAASSGSGKVKFTYGPLNRVVNIHWAGGLAVEFEPDNT